MKRLMCERAAIGCQTVKLTPQPQEATAFGFLTLNDWPIRSSTKSGLGAFQHFKRHRIDQHSRAVTGDRHVVFGPAPVDIERILKER